MPSRALAFALLVSLPAMGGLGAARADAPPYWRDRTSFFRAFAQPHDVVMIGDSITDGAEWREMFPQVDVVNRGIDSDTTTGVLARLGDVLATRPKQAFLMIGINDFAEGHVEPDAVFANYRRIVETLTHAGVQVVVQTTLPCNEVKGQWRSCASLNPKIRALNQRLASLAAGNVKVVDLSPALAANGQLRTDFTNDGIHLNGDGYLAWRKVIAPLMPAPRAATARP